MLQRYGVPGPGPSTAAYRLCRTLMASNIRYGEPGTGYKAYATSVRAREMKSQKLSEGPKQHRTERISKHTLPDHAVSKSRHDRLPKAKHHSKVPTNTHVRTVSAARASHRSTDGPSMAKPSVAQKTAPRNVDKGKDLPRSNGTRTSQEPRQTISSESHRETTSAPAHDSQDVLDYVPRMLAPPNSTFTHQVLNEFDELMSKGEIKGLATAFLRLSPDTYAVVFGMERWQRVSELFKDISHNPERAINQFTFFLDKDPEVYGALSTMCIEAAGRHAYDGLYSVMLILLAAGRPQEVIHLYRRYRDTLIIVQEKNASHFHSWVRADRLAARVESPGIKPISLVVIAAFSISNQLTPSNMISCLASRDDWAHIPQVPKTHITNALSYGKLASEDIAKFRAGLKKFRLAVLCHHAESLVTAIIKIASSGESETFHDVLNSLLEASIGPDRWLTPIAARTTDRTMKGEIVLPEKIWHAIVRSMGMLRKPVDIIMLVDKHLPDRGLVPSEDLLFYAFRSLEEIMVDKNLPPDQIKAAYNAFDRINDIASDLGVSSSDKVYAARVRCVLSLGGWREFFNEFDKCRHLPTGIGPYTRAVFAIMMVKHQRLDQAMEVLGWTKNGDPDFVQPLSLHPYIYAIDSMSRSKMDPALCLKYIDRVIVNNKTLQGASIPPSRIPALSSLRLLAAGPKALARELALLTGPGNIWHDSYAEWAAVIMQVTRTKFRNRNESLLFAEFGLMLLRRFCTLSQTIPRGRVISLFNEYWATIVAYSYNSPEERRHYQQASFEVFREKFPAMDLWAFKLLIGVEHRRYNDDLKLEQQQARLRQFSFDNRTRRENPTTQGTFYRNGVAINPTERDKPRHPPSLELAHHWRRSCHEPTPDIPGQERAVQASNSKREARLSRYYWHFMHSFLRTGGRDEAAKVVKDAWETGIIWPRNTRFWDRASELGLLRIAGITAEDIEAKRRSHTPTRDSEGDQNGRIDEEEPEEEEDEAEVESDRLEID